MYDLQFFLIIRLKEMTISQPWSGFDAPILNLIEFWHLLNGI